MGIRTELSLRLPNSPGALAGVCRALADERIGIVAMSLGAAGQVRLVVDNPVRALGVLRAGRHQVTEREVLFVAMTGGAGMLAPILGLISDAGINLEYAYGGAGDSRTSGAIVLGVDDAMRAAAAAGV
jgi:hypothetical protein